MAAELALAALSGVLYFVGFVGYGQHYLTWICFVPVLWAIRATSPRRALLLGTVFGAIMSWGGFYWVADMLAQFANLNAFLSALGLLLLCLQHGLGLGLVLWAVRRLGRDRGIAPVWSLPLALTAHEIFYPHIFPFYIGASQYQLPWVTQIAEIFGIVGLSALIALVNGAFYELLVARRGYARRRIIVPLAALIATLAFGALRTAQIDALSAQAPKRKVALIQTNLGAKDKHTRGDEFLKRHLDMTARAIAQDPSIELVVWPESAYNRWLDRGTKTLAGTPLSLGRPMIFGTLLAERGPDGALRGFNGSVITSSTGQVLGTYEKIRLLVFGEAIPLVDTFPALKRYLPMASTFTRGSSRAPLVGPDGTRYLTMICYEDILPSFVRELWNEGGPSDVLVNVTNDSWYGDSDEPLEHLALATFRSIETRRALIRSTNTGISALVDPVGRLQARTGQWTEETLVGEVPLIRDGGSTPYMRIGDAPAMLASAALLALLFGQRKKRA